MKNQNSHFQLNVLLALVLGTLLSCTEIAKKEKDSHPTNPTSSIFTISLGDGITHQGVIGLKEMAEEIQYVKLEFTPECALGRIVHLIATQNYFFVADIRMIYQFSRNGKFIRKVGSKGKGPGEYLGFRDLSVDETDQKLYILTNWTKEILIYGFDGNYLGKIPLKDDSIEKCDYIGDSLLALQVHPIERKSLLSTELIDEQGNSIIKVNSSVIKLSEINNWMGSNLVYSFNQKVNVKEFNNDTVFQITPQGLVPYFILELGTYASPLTYTQKEPKKYIQPYRIFENDQRIIIYFFYDDKKCIAQYNKETGFTSVSIPENDKQQGILNDIDNGMNFVVTMVPFSLKTTQNEWLLPVQAINLVKYCDQKEVRGNLKELMSHLKVEDNPVIMVVKFK
jgi:hypothetical protein